MQQTLHKVIIMHTNFLKHSSDVWSWIIINGSLYTYTFIWCLDTLIDLNYLLLSTYYLRLGAVHLIKNIFTFHTHQFPIDYHDIKSTKHESGWQATISSSICMLHSYTDCIFAFIYNTIKMSREVFINVYARKKCRLVSIRFRSVGHKML